MKKLIIAFCLVMASAVSQASYLWFTIENNATKQDSGFGDVANYLNNLSGVTEDNVYAYVVAKDTAGKTTKLYTDTGFTTTWEIAPAVANVDLSALTESLNAYSFYIEIATAASGVYNPVGYATETQTYTQLYNSGYVTESTLDIPSVATVWHGSGFKATPEPTSGILVILGAALMGLKRKARKEA